MQKRLVIGETGRVNMFTDDGTFSILTTDGVSQQAYIYNDTVSTSKDLSIDSYSGVTNKGIKFTTQGNQRFRIGENGQFGLGVNADSGTSGQVLTSQGNSAAPIWSNASAGGVPAPPSSNVVLPAGNILNNEFTKATISGTNIQLNGNVIGTTVGSGVTVNSTNGLSTTIGSHVVLNSINFTPEFTLEFYFKMIGGNFHVLFDSMKGPISHTNQISIDRSNTSNGLRFYINRPNGGGIGTTGQETNTSLAGFDGTFGHLVCLLSATQGLKVYSNGVLVNTTPFQNFNQNTYSHGTWNYNYLGARVSYPSANLMDNAIESIKTFRVFNRALSAAEIQTLYANRNGATDVTNFRLVSSNSVGTATKWEEVAYAHILEIHPLVKYNGGHFSPYQFGTSSKIDTANGWNSSTHKYTIPTSGYWYVHSIIGGFTNGAANFYHYIYHYNSSTQSTTAIADGRALFNDLGSTQFETTGNDASTIRYLNKGDQIWLSCVSFSSGFFGDGGRADCGFRAYFLRK